MTILINLLTGHAAPSDPNNPEDVRQADEHNREEAARAARMEELTGKDRWSKEDALFMLEDIGSHAYLRETTARRIAAPFDAPVRVERQINEGDKGLFTKGLSSEGLPVGAVVEGVSAWLLAEDIALAVDPSYVSGFIGRGFRFRAALARIRAVIGETVDA